MNGAAAADHCTYLDDADVDALASSATVATLLPGVEFSTRQPYPDARRLLGAGATVAFEDGQIVEHARVYLARGPGARTLMVLPESTAKRPL